MIWTEYNEEEVYRLMRRDAKEEGLEEGRKEGRKEGREEGTIKVLCELVEDGTLPLEKAAERAGLSPEEFLQKAEALGQTDI